MLEMSAAASPARALPGAVLMAVPAEAGAEGAGSQDFSAVLANAALETGAIDTPALTTVTPDFAAVGSGKTGTPGNLTGKTLPVGSLQDETDAADDTVAPTTDPAFAPPAFAFLPPIDPAVVPTPTAQLSTGAPVMVANLLAAQRQLFAPLAEAVAPVAAATVQPVTAVQTDPSAAVPAAQAEAAAPQLAAAEPAERKAQQPAPIDVPAVAARIENAVPGAPSETRNTAPLATPLATPAPSTPAPAAQDLGALVDRIAAARAAAAPETIRAALMHEEFGAVSLRFRADDTHIQVTLGSADPGFAPAVHAAAAASQANTDARDGNRRDQPTPQPSAQTTSQNNPAAQQQQQAFQQQAGRTAAREPASGRSAAGRSTPDQTPNPPLRRSGIYA